MDVVGVTEDGRVAFGSELPQGADPHVLAHDLGYLTLRPLAAERREDGRLEVRLAVRALNGEPRPAQQSRGRDPGLSQDLLGPVEVRQRVAAYAVIVSSLGLLATEFSDRTSVPGQWGIPGGGIDEDEQPTEALLREVAEETGQDVVVGELVQVQTSHWVGRSPRDTIEDYHAVRLVYEATCPTPSEPVVADVGGTTESARWVPLQSWTTMGWTVGWRQVLRMRLAGQDGHRP